MEKFYNHFLRIKIQMEEVKDFSTIKADIILWARGFFVGVRAYYYEFLVGVTTLYFSSLNFFSIHSFNLNFYVNLYA